MSYNIDDIDSDDAVIFQLGGKNYELRFPTTDEALALGDLKDASATNPSKALEAVYKFVTPVDKDAPSIKEALGGSSVKKLQKFMEMVQTEFSLGTPQES